jgi:16S rRNA (cytosine1402-N4)-methyltransferase
LKEPGTEFSHTTVMPGEVIEYLRPAPSGVYVDGTVGGGGHALEILRASAPGGRVIGLDRDVEAIEAASKRLAGFGGQVVLVRGNFKEARGVLKGLGIDAVDGVILDLGVSSHQLDSAGRGFSFRAHAPLDMRMDRTEGPTAADLVAGLDEAELARIFRDYGEERFSTRIARAIVREREDKPIETTGALKEIIVAAVPRKFHGTRIHPATRVFQALRIAVNAELEGLGDAIIDIAGVLKPGGVIVIISFHSLEDRIVKRTFRELATGCVCPPRSPQCVCGRTPAFRVLTRRAVKASAEEVAANPRARSAKLRAVEKL